MATSKKKKVDPKTSDELIEMFDAGDDVSEYLDTENAIFTVNVGFPTWMVKKLDQEAQRLAVPRQAVIKQACDEYLKNRR